MNVSHIWGGKGKYPNEEFFVKRIQLGDIVKSGRQLRSMERGHLENNMRGDMHNYKRLCQGEIFLDEELQDKTCRLLTYHPSFILGEYLSMHSHIEQVFSYLPANKGKDPSFVCCYLLNMLSILIWSNKLKSITSILSQSQFLPSSNSPWYL